MLTVMLVVCFPGLLFYEREKSSRYSWIRYFDGIRSKERDRWCTHMTLPVSWFQPIWKICSSNWTSCRRIGVNKKYLTPPPSSCVHWNMRTGFDLHLKIYSISKKTNAQVNSNINSIVHIHESNHTPVMQMHVFVQLITSRWINTPAQNNCM